MVVAPSRRPAAAAAVALLCLNVLLVFGSREPHWLWEWLSRLSSRQSPLESVARSARKCRHEYRKLRREQRQYDEERLQLGKGHALCRVKSDK